MPNVYVEMLWGGSGDHISIAALTSPMEPRHDETKKQDCERFQPMSRPLDMDATVIAVIEMSQSGWLVGSEKLKPATNANGVLCAASRSPLDQRASMLAQIIIKCGVSALQQPFERAGSET
jgi:hypothetical protein